MRSHKYKGLSTDGSVARAQGGSRLAPGRCATQTRLPLVVFLPALLAGGCFMVGPDYSPPKAPEPELWLAKDDPRIKSVEANLSSWWKVFEDPVIDELIDAAYRQNLTLQIAGLRVVEARTQLAIVVGDLYPQIQQLNVDYTFNHSSKNAPNTTPSADFTFGDLALGFDAAWELDIWGKFRRGIESSLGALESTIASYDDILVTLTAEVARTYVVIRTLESRLEVARENVRIQERSLQIVEAQFTGGEVTELDVQQARALLGETRALIPELEAGVRQSRNALSTLLGVLPGQVDSMLEEPRPIPTVPAEVVVGVPAELLRRRPDIRAAERRVAAQCAQIGVAEADLYPHLSLIGSIGLRGSDASLTAAGFPGGSSFGDFFSSDSVSGFVGPSFSWDVLNYGRIRNRVRLQDAVFQELAIDYQNTVLEAAREVEDAMAAFLRGQEQAQFLGQAVAAARRSVDIALLQYMEGLVDYQRVLDTQRVLARQQDLLTAVTGTVATDLISTYKALGGGWQIRIGQDFVPETVREQMAERTNWGDLLSTEEQELPPEEARSTIRTPDF